ncbi:tetratricopeptide repeat protein [Spirosoma soli]|uniref:Tetratricopeptide repeat protein n=1 Tax=Spirosoma soli TaxID=1770529 RepID=A0ABW5LWI2_9BACT
MKRSFILLLLLSFGAKAVWAQNAQSITQAIRYIKLANTLRAVNKSDESVKLLMRALPATVQAKNLYWEAVTNELLGLSYNDLQDPTRSVRYLEKAREQYAKLKYVASAWGVNEVIRDISGKNLYAGIQIGASDIKLAILKTKYETDFYEKDIKSTITIPNPTVTLFADASGALRSGQDALRACLDTIQQYNIPNERVFVVLSSEVRDQLVKNPEDRKKLYDQLVKVLPNSNLKIDTTLSTTRQAELFTVGAIPRKVWPTTSALELGSNQTVGGYFDANKKFHNISFPFGTNTLVSQIDNKGTMNLDAFKREAQRVVKAIADSSVTPRLKANDTGLQQRRTVGVSGDIVWALVTYLYPEKSDITAVGITLDDVERFKRLAMDDLKTLTRPNLAAIEDPTVRGKAEKNLNVVQQALNEKQLIAGALWLESIMKSYSADSVPKRFVFIRNADIGWVTGKFLETINYEYESTIAKGALYTR